ncbi:MAG: maleylpyruvate isomerase N-terminal domain-containing protein [Chloroflexota bacterium]
MSSSSSPSPAEAIRQAREARAAIVRELATLTEEQCTRPVKWSGLDRNVNFLLRVLSLHELDHIQHLQKLLRSRGRSLTEPQILLIKAQTLRAELEATLLSLTDEEFDTPGAGEGDWTPRQVLAHLADVDGRYAQLVREAVG